MEERIEELETENKALRMENAELKERLGLNSKNSSIPNFKELYKIKKDIAHLKLIGMIDKKAESRA